jgi:hypothetical protein
MTSRLCSALHRCRARSVSAEAEITQRFNSKYITIENCRWLPFTEGRVFAELHKITPVRTPAVVIPFRQRLLRLFEALTLLDM